MKLSINPTEFIWSQKYRPKTISDMILPEEVKKTLIDNIKKNNIPNYLFSGPPGIGKSTLGIAICNELDADYLLINASKDNGIDVIRTQVTNFASSVSFDGNIKIVILDEADYLSDNAQASLRGLLEQFSANCRFILTCNFANKIMSPLHSRCTVIDLLPKPNQIKEMKLGIYKRCISILENENIEFDQNSKGFKNVIGNIIKEKYPDFRSIVTELQNITSTGKVEMNMKVKNIDNRFLELVDILNTKDFKRIRQWVGENTDIQCNILFRNIYDYFSENLSDGNKIANIILVIAQYQLWATTVADQEINTTACLVEVCKSL